MCDEFDIPVPIDRARDILRQKFRANAHIKDTRVIDMLVVKVRYHDKGITMSIANIIRHSFCSVLLNDCIFIFVRFRVSRICRRLSKFGLRQRTSCQNTLKKRSKRGRKISCPNFYRAMNKCFLFIYKHLDAIISVVNPVIASNVGSNVYTICNQYIP